LSGDFAIQEAPTALDATAGMDLMGMGIQAGIRVVGDDAYVSLFGQWYEAPAESQDELLGVDTAALMEKVQQMMETLEIDPSAWVKDLKSVGDEKLADTDVVHLTGTLDLEKMLDDVMEIMQSPEMAEIMAMTSSTADSADMDMGIDVPTASELEEILADLDEMLDEVTMDFWLAKDDGSVRQMEMDAHIILPQDSGLEGITGITAAVTLALDKIGQQVNIQAPADAKPIEQLQQDLQQNPLFGAFLGGGLDLEF
jgi:hypothetical protein